MKHPILCCQLFKTVAKLSQEPSKQVCLIDWKFIYLFIWPFLVLHFQNCLRLLQYKMSELLSVKKQNKSTHWLDYFVLFLRMLWFIWTMILILNGLVRSFSKTTENKNKKRHIWPFNKKQPSNIVLSRMQNVHTVRFK